MNEVNDFKPLTSVRAAARVKIAYSIKTSTESHNLNYDDFTVTVSRALECELASLVNVSSQTTLNVIANGTNVLNFDTTTVIVLSSKLTNCTSDTPTVSAAITPLKNDHP